MAKESGLGFTVTIDDSSSTGRDISNDITNFDISTPSNFQITTGLDKSAQERLVLLADASVTLNGVFNDAANLAHAVFSDYRSITTTGRTSVFALSGQTLTMELVPMDYSISRPASGEALWTVPMALSDGTVPTWA